MALLEVKDLHTSFFTDAGEVKAVDGVSFQLEHGKALMEMLKQPLCQPKSDAEQVVILVLASHGLLDTLPTAEQREKTAAFVRQFRADVSGTMQKIDADGKLEPDRVDAILNAWKAYAGGNDHVVQ